MTSRLRTRSQTKKTATRPAGRWALGTGNVAAGSKKDPGWRLPASQISASRLLQLARCAGFDKLLENALRVGLGNAFLDRLGSSVHQILGFLEAKTGHGLNEAKDLVDAAPKAVKEGVSKADAESILKQLVEAGATGDIK